MKGRFKEKELCHFSDHSCPSIEKYQAKPLNVWFCMRSQALHFLSHRTSDIDVLKQGGASASFLPRSYLVTPFFILRIRRGKAVAKQGPDFI